MDDTLGWLWDELAGPVLTWLGTIGPPEEGQGWPPVVVHLRVLPSLPLHAAGHHRTRFEPTPPPWSTA